MTKEQISNAIETYKKVYMMKNGFPAGTMCAVAISALDGVMEYIEYIGKLLETESKVNPEVEEPVSDDLEEAADNHIRKVVDAAGHPGWDWETQDIADAFIAGAKWDREQMMEDAVEGEVCIPNVWVEHKEGKELVVRAEISKELGFKFGDKVRVIVCKKEDAE